MAGFGRRWSQSDIDNAKDRQKPKENAKIKNATVVEMDGIKFASKLELYCYNMLKAVGIPFEFQVTIVLQEKFRASDGTLIREIKMIPDFVLEQHDLIVDTKGFQTPESKLKFKMLKHKIYSEGRKTKIELPKNQTEVGNLINRLLSEKRKSQAL